MSKKRRPTDEGGSWMDTYGDMVTLLLTFFIMLYSMSTVDAQKWNIFVSSISPEKAQEAEKQADQVTVNGTIGEGELSSGGETIGKPEDGGVQELDITDPNTLYLTISERLNQIGVAGAFITRGEDYTYITFKDSTFFDSNSSVLTKQGQMVLTALCQSIAPAAGGIGQINIMAHTAKANPNGETNVRLDRILSATRAAEVSIFIQEANIIEPEKLVNISYGEYRPIADNSTPQGRAKNRRVELILLDKGAKEKELDEYYSDLQSGVYEDTTILTVGKPTS